MPVPQTSSKEKLKDIHELLRQDPNLCRLCGDSFCRDPTWGDPYLVDCTKCGCKFHSFCVDCKPDRPQQWRCYKCQHSPKPLLVTISDGDPSLLCQFCHRTSSGKLAGRLVGYGGLGDTGSNYVHENCAFYSKGVTKREDQWFGLHSAVRESHLTKCSFCQKKGASIPCDFPKCRKLFHYLCAKHNECFWVENNSQRLYCDQHMECILKNPDMLQSTPKVTPFIPPASSSPEVVVPQANGKKKQQKKRKRPSVPDDDGEEDTSLSCQVT